MRRRLARNTAPDFTTTFGRPVDPEDDMSSPSGSAAHAPASTPPGTGRAAAASSGSRIAGTGATLAATAASSTRHALTFARLRTSQVAAGLSRWSISTIDAPRWTRASTAVT